MILLSNHKRGNRRKIIKYIPTKNRKYNLERGYTVKRTGRKREQRNKRKTGERKREERETGDK